MPESFDLHDVYSCELLPLDLDLNYASMMPLPCNTLLLWAIPDSCDVRMPSTSVHAE